MYCWQKEAKWRMDEWRPFSDHSATISFPFLVCMTPQWTWKYLAPFCPKQYIHGFQPWPIVWWAMNLDLKKKTIIAQSTKHMGTCWMEDELKKLMQYSIRPIGILFACKRESDSSALRVPKDLASEEITFERLHSFKWFIPLIASSTKLGVQFKVVLCCTYKSNRADRTLHCWFGCKLVIN